MSKGAWLLGGCAVLGLSWSVGMLSFADAPSQAVPETGVANAVSVDLIAQAREAPEIGQWDRTSEDFDSRKKRWDDTLTFEVDAGDISVFDVVTPHGDVVIVGDDGDVIRVSARRVVRSSKEDKGATHREGFRPVARMDGNVLAVGVLRPEGKEQAPPEAREGSVRRLHDRRPAATRRENGWHGWAGYTRAVRAWRCRREGCAAGHAVPALGTR